MRRERQLTPRLGSTLLVATLCLVSAASRAAVTSPVPAATAPGPDSGASLSALLDSARLWRQRGRDDLSRAALVKLLSVDPGHREGLRLLTAIEIEAGHAAEAEQLIQRLDAARPGSPEAGELRELSAAARSQGVSVVRDRLRAIGGAGAATRSPVAVSRTERGTAGAESPTRIASQPRTARRITRGAAPVRVAAAIAPVTPPSPGETAATPDPAELARAHRSEADALLERGDAAGAIAALEKAVALDPESAWARFDLARLQQRGGDAAAARATIDAGLAAAPDDPEMAYAAALYLAGVDAETQARATIARIDRARWSEGMVRLDTRLRIAELLATARVRADGGDAEGTRAALREATALAPGDASVLVRSGWTAQSVGDYAQSRRYFDDAVSVARVAGASDEAAAAGRGIDHLESKRQRFVTSGFEISDKPGDRGISRFERRIVPVELRWAIDYDRYLFAHADYLDLSAGRLDLTDYAAVTRYGQLLAAGPPGPGGTRHPGASGVMIGAGYEDQHWRFDAGHLPGGFPVSYAVGGARYSTRTAGVDWSVEAARRPVTSTLISFAGVRDPAGGGIWGGARRTGLTLNASREFRGHEAYGRLTVNAIDGRNIADNTEIELRAGYDWYARAREDSRLSVSTTATFWHFKRNQRFQTFGHGGYYSPQAYLSVALPVQWSGTRGRWSWRTRAAVAWSTTREDDAFYHPTDAALQARAAAQAAGNGFAAPIHEGGHGGGISGSASGSIEFRITDAWSIGARFEIDRSEDYAPDTVGVWFRYRFNRRGAFYGAPRPPRVYAYY